MTETGFNYQVPKKPFYKKPLGIVVIVVGVFIVMGIFSSLAGGSDDTKASDDSTTQGTGKSDEPKADEKKAAAEKKAAPVKEAPDNEGVFTIEVHSTESNSGSVTYMVPEEGSFDMQQANNTRFPFKKTWTGVDSIPLGWNMNAQQQGAGEITCIVKHDGEVVKKNTSSGAYAMVICSG